MRVLWVTAEPPDRGGGGGNIRQARLLEAVAAAGHEVDLLLAGGPPDEGVRAAVRRLDQVPFRRTRRPTNRWAGRLLELRLAVRGGPAELHDNGGARAALSAHWPGETYDLVLVEHAGLAPLVRHRRPGERWVCTLQNVASGTAAALRDIAPGRRQRLMISREVEQASRLERYALERYDSVVSVSEDDAALLPGPSVVIHNGVDLSAFRPTPLPAEPRLLFTGTLSYLPNVDGSRWFCAEVLPLVLAQVPEVVLDVVGRAPVPEVRALHDGDRVRVHADVPSVAPYLEAARVCLVPLRIGTGSRLKALEAMAAGRPTVGTTVGLAGLELTDEALIADEPQALADAVVRLLRDDGAANRLAAAGRAHVEQAFGWESIGRRFVAHLEELSRT